MKKFNLFIYFLAALSLYFLIFVSVTHAAGTCGTTGKVGSDPYTANSNSYSDVNSCVSQVSAGDTINVPAGSGSVIWTSQLNINKGMNLIGPGAANLTIVNNQTIVYLWMYYFTISYNPSNYDLNTPFRLSGFTFDANGRNNLELGGGKTAPFTRQTKVRVDHNIFTNTNPSGYQKGQAIWNEGSLYGVVDNNVITGIEYPIANSFNVDADNWWANSPQNIFELGSENYLYFEDNAINITPRAGQDNIVAADGEYSPRYVFRYNTITTPVASYSMFDIHGEQATPMASAFGAEIYGNNIIATNNNYLLSSI